MGGKHSVRSILITADQASSAPGSNITGKIYMKFEKPVRASTLWLKFKGKELVYWSAGSMSAKAKGLTNLINLKAAVMIWENGEIPSGDYEIPYAYTLPENLLNSFHLENPHYSADITYKLKVEIEPEKHKKIKNSVTVEIYNPVQAKEGIAISSNIPVGHCCSTRRFRINAQLDKTAYSPLEKPQVSMEINNSESGANLDWITLSLTRQIILHSNKKHHTFFNEPIASHKVKGCGKGKICEKESALITFLNLEKTQKTLHNAPTIKTGKIECIYKLNLDFTSHDACVKNIGYCEIPIIICPHIMEVPKPAPEAPPEWHPVTYDMQRLSYAYAEAYAPSAPPLEEDE
ncbi:unnamed protein product [Blepharisma stoltei]|uniref:Arrestin C-terminal-like domain-containing protein n=1 Tax=Blepharisma stoltei TaxID=1481888 RepID=A0AAU9K6Y0_9CILI|nr:unnamed protein product [Blepharisma stoltei]